ncbi:MULTISPECIES: DUF6088 family protein [unclassified Mycoplasma]|uniref:DUF6088 family protein n=1 Tax=unclassified Mycoplasma TaxID=2683645 RepID=UPI00211D1390|nr:MULTISPECIES: DUF6088 family protein [unclassified Mycoplasma]UUM20091.1 DUF6088 family protein [Mycoplasma sp. 1578d]UUM25071.1 DUF6088 family protein [Mycoplasma sp. 3686d]
MQTATSTIENMMIKNPGKIYSINDFYKMAPKNTIKSILKRLKEKGVIVRVMDGLYAKPVYIEELNKHFYPTVKEVANKIAEKFDWTIALGGQITLNYTGLSTQVPSEYVYISDGKSIVYNYRNQKN